MFQIADYLFKMRIRFLLVLNSLVGSELSLKFFLFQLTPVSFQLNLLIQAIQFGLYIVVIKLARIKNFLKVSQIYLVLDDSQNLI